VHSPDYYKITSYLDVFGWLGTRPPPALAVEHIMQILPIYAVGMRYAVRCLWKATHPYGMAEDCDKAADSFAKLGAALRRIASEEQPPAPEGV